METLRLFRHEGEKGYCSTLTSLGFLITDCRLQTVMGEAQCTAWAESMREGMTRDHGRCDLERVSLANMVHSQQI